MQNNLKFPSRIELAEHFRDLGFKIGAEIGVADGRFSERLCQIIPGLRLYCIDPWMPYKGNHRGGGKGHQNRNLDRARDRLRPYDAVLVRKMSTTALLDFRDDFLDFVFIDGNHDYDYVMEDIIGWTRKVRPGGIVSGHDYYHFTIGRAGVVEAVDDYCRYHKIQVNFTGKEIKKNPLDDKQPSWWFVKK